MHLASEQAGEILSTDLAVTHDAVQQPGADRPTGVDWHDGCSAIGVTKEVMASLDPDDPEATFPSAAISSRPVSCGRRDISRR
jgi:hypothetical protein